MCMCVENIERDYQRNNYRGCEVEVQEAHVDGWLFPVIRFSYYDKATGKIEIGSLFPDYCPFCGEKYDHRDISKFEPHERPDEYKRICPTIPAAKGK